MEPCLITTRYLQGVAGIVENSVLHDRWLSNLRDLQERAKTAGDGRKRELLRGFFCLETMVSRSWSRTLLVGTVPGGTRDWKRSAAGLTRLLAIIREQSDDCLAALAEYSMLAESRRNEDQIDKALTRRRHATIAVIEKAAARLRSALKHNGDTDVSLGPMGGLLHLTAGSWDVHEQIQVAENLLACTEDNAKRAWE